jgi:TPR repeat protein
MKKDDELLSTIMPMMQYKRPEAKVRLGRMYAYGRGVEQDLEKAKTLMEEAAAKRPKYKGEYEKALAKLKKKGA